MDIGNKGKIKVALVAACDRYNYGDVLLPVIFEEYYMLSGKEGVEFKYYGLAKRDLRSIGGKATLPLYKLDGSIKYVIVAGGEVLNVNYLSMFLNLQTSKAVIYFFRKLRRVSLNLTNGICKKILRGKNLLPWYIFPQNRSQKIFYNAVGGTTIGEADERQKSEVLKVIDLSTSFSVRDNATFESLKEMGSSEKLRLLPDTAILMSKVFPCDRLESKISDYVKNLISATNQVYYVVQMSKAVGDEIKDDIVLAINEYYKKKNITCVLLPIGRVQGHEDILPLREIRDKTVKGACLLVEENNIYDVMYIIAHSRAFIGSSLHGIITAAAYEVPHTIISSRLEKLVSFVNTWNTTSNVSIDSDHDFVEFLARPDLKQTVGSKNIQSMQCKVQNYFDELIQMIGSADMEM